MTPADHEALVKRLREIADDPHHKHWPSGQTIREAATALESLAARPQMVTEEFSVALKCMEMARDMLAPDQPISGIDYAWALLDGNAKAGRAALAAAPPPTSQSLEAKCLGDLLAIIHGDGGHYQAEHGTEKATQDAIEKWYAKSQPLPAPPTEQNKP